MLKPLIIVLLAGVLISLFSGLVFLFKDSERLDSKRTLYALGIRVSLAAALLVTLFYGFYTGQLRIGTNAPWHDRADTATDSSQPIAPAEHQPE
ncbi:MAG: DUF2909 domain-containing protein [Pseudomonadales bacterium]